MSVPPPPSTGPRRSVGPLRALLLHTRGLIVNQHLRRVTMFYAVLIPMLMVFAGVEFLGNWMDPHRHFYRFAIYWMVCGWLTILAALLAVYDILITRLQARALQRALRAKALGRDFPAEEPEE